MGATDGRTFIIAMMVVGWFVRERGFVSATHAITLRENCMNPKLVAGILAPFCSIVKPRRGVLHWKDG